MLGKSVKYNLENVFLNGTKVVGIESFDSSFGLSSSPIMMMGGGYINSLPQSSPEKTFGFSMYTCSGEENILSKVDQTFETTYAYRTNLNDAQSHIWQSESGWLTSYELKCSVGEIAKSAFSFDCLGAVSLAGNQATSTEVGSIIIVKPGDVSVSAGELTDDNLIQSFTYKFEVPITKKNTIGGIFVPTAELIEPIKVTVDMEFNLQDASSIEISDLSAIFCEDGFAADFTLENCGTLVRELSISGARMTNCSMNGAVGSNATLSVSYETYVSTYSGLKTMLGL